MAKARIVLRSTSLVAIQPEAMTLGVAVATYGISRAGLYRLAKAGVIRIVKNNRQSLVIAADIRTYINSLPAASLGNVKA